MEKLDISNQEIEPKGKVIIFCAPSGSGKTTITHHVMSKFSNLAFSVSATTRPKREGEVEGRDYYYLSVDEFKQKITNNEFVEFEENYEAGRFYGTLKSEVKRLGDDDKVIVFDVDVRGAMSLKKYFGDHALMAFIRVPFEDLRKRLEARGKDSVDSINARIEAAKKEIEYADDADVVIENVDLEKAKKDAEKVVLDFLETSF